MPTVTVGWLIFLMVKICVAGLLLYFGIQIGVLLLELVWEMLKGLGRLVNEIVEALDKETAKLSDRYDRWLWKGKKQ